jgi:hypothetical protein
MQTDNGTYRRGQSRAEMTRDRKIHGIVESGTAAEKLADSETYNTKLPVLPYYFQITVHGVGYSQYQERADLAPRQPNRRKGHGANLQSLEGYGQRGKNPP